MKKLQIRNNLSFIKNHPQLGQTCKDSCNKISQSIQNSAPHFLHLYALFIVDNKGVSHAKQNELLNKNVFKKLILLILYPSTGSFSVKFASGSRC